MALAIRPEESAADRAFINGLNQRLVEVTEAPAHSKSDVANFQPHYTKTVWKENSQKIATLIALNENGDRLGFVKLRDTEDEITFERCGYIALLAVTEEAEGEGVAQALIKSAEKLARKMGFKRLCLDVFASNHRGQRFYEKMDFKPETIRVIK